MIFGSLRPENWLDKNKCVKFLTLILWCVSREGVAEEERVILKGLRKPIFVEVNDYRKVIEEIKLIKKDSKKSKELVRALGDFKVKNSIKIKNWETGLEKIQRDLIFMDKILFEESGGNKW